MTVGIVRRKEEYTEDCKAEETKTVVAEDNARSSNWVPAKYDGGHRGKTMSEKPRRLAVVGNPRDRSMILYFKCQT